MGSIAVGLLMGMIALQLMRTNKRFLIGGWVAAWASVEWGGWGTWQHFFTISQQRSGRVTGCLSGPLCARHVPICCVCACRPGDGASG